MATKKKAKAEITLTPPELVQPGATVTAHLAVKDDDERAYSLRVNGTAYNCYNQDGDVRTSFLLERAGDYNLQFVCDDKVVAETTFSV